MQYMSSSQPEDTGGPSIEDEIWSSTSQADEAADIAEDMLKPSTLCRNNYCSIAARVETDRIIGSEERMHDFRLQDVTQV